MSGDVTTDRNVFKRRKQKKMATQADVMASMTAQMNQMKNIVVSFPGTKSLASSEEIPWIILKIDSVFSHLLHIFTLRNCVPVSHVIRHQSLQTGTRPPTTKL